MSKSHIQCLYESLQREFPEKDIPLYYLNWLFASYGIDTAESCPAGLLKLIDAIYLQDFSPFTAPYDGGEMTSVFLEIQDRYGLPYEDDGEFAKLWLPASGKDAIRMRTSNPEAFEFWDVRR